MCRTGWLSQSEVQVFVTDRKINIVASQENPAIRNLPKHRLLTFAPFAAVHGLPLHFEETDTGTCPALLTTHHVYR